MSAELHYITNIDLNSRLSAKSDITVETIAQRDAILTWRRKWSMIVGVYNDPTPANNGFYYLQYDKNSTVLGDNDNWTKLNLDAFGSGVKIVGLEGVSGYIEAEAHNLGSDIQIDFYSVDGAEMEIIDIYYKILNSQGRIYWKSGIIITGLIAIIK